MKRYAVAAAIIGLPLAAAAQEMDQPRWMANMARHQRVIMHGVPAPYVAMRDPSRDTPAKLRQGRALFDRNCASCHGWSGQGSGPEGFFMVPAPADLAWLARTPKGRADPYIYWSIAEGGKPVDSEMPAFKQSLSEREIWSVAAYLRAGMPNASP